MQRIYIKDIRDNLEKSILVQGFVENFRDGKAMCFIVLKDITGKVQITIEKEGHEELLPALGQITPDSVISVIGVAHESEYVKMGGIEIIPTEIKVESVAAALPIQREDIPATKKKAAVARSGIDDRMDYRWIDLRTDRNQLIFKAQTIFTKAMRDFLYERGFLEIHTPKLIGAASESGSEVFEVKYHGYDESTSLGEDRPQNRRYRRSNARSQGRTTASANNQRGREFRAVYAQNPQEWHGMRLSDQRQPVGR